MGLDLELGGLDKIDLVPVGEAVAEKLKPTIKEAVTQISITLLVGFLIIGGAIKSKSG